MNKYLDVAIIINESSVIRTVVKSKIGHAKKRVPEVLSIAKDKLKRTSAKKELTKLGADSPVNRTILRAVRGKQDATGLIAAKSKALTKEMAVLHNEYMALDKLWAVNKSPAIGKKLAKLKAILDKKSIQSRAMRRKFEDAISKSDAASKSYFKTIRS